MQLITDEQFKLFKDEVERWLTQFGLLEWSVTVNRDVICAGSKAWTQANITGRSVGIFINEDAECHKDDNDIRKSAFHEVLELLLWDYEDICINSGTRFATDKVRCEAIESARHAVLRRIENGIFSNIGAWE